MPRFRTLTFCLGLFLFTAPMAQAQQAEEEPLRVVLFGPAAQQFAWLVEELTLTMEQQREAQELLRRHGIAVLHARRGNREDLAAARAAIAAKQAETDAALKALFTEEQQAKYDAMGFWDRERMPRPDEQQGPRGVNRAVEAQLSRIETELELTERQQELVRETLTAHMPGLLSVRDQVRDASPEQRRELMGQMAQKLEAMDEEIEQHLTDEQIDAFRKMRDQEQQRQRRPPQREGGH